jgi:hypothetical protein
MELQLSFFERPEVEAAVAGMAASGAEYRGAVFTRSEVVEFILDLAGYTAGKPLHRARILEPSMGHGDFLAPVIDRLFDVKLQGNARHCHERAARQRPHAQPARRFSTSAP